MFPLKLRLASLILAGSVVGAAFLVPHAMVRADDAPATQPAPATPKHEVHVRPIKFNSILDQLNLTDDQKTQIVQINKDINEERKKLEQKQKDEIAAVLTDDQKSQEKDLQAKAEADAKQRRADELERKRAASNAAGTATVAPATQPMEK